jgi:hypothetical protein
LHGLTGHIDVAVDQQQKTNELSLPMRKLNKSIFLCVSVKNINYPLPK